MGEGRSEMGNSQILYVKLFLCYGAFIPAYRLPRPSVNAACSFIADSRGTTTLGRIEACAAGVHDVMSILAAGWSLDHFSARFEKK